MKIAISGKGGVGKTSLTAWLGDIWRGVVKKSGLWMPTRRFHWGRHRVLNARRCQSLSPGAQRLLKSAFDQPVKAA